MGALKSDLFRVCEFDGRDKCDCQIKKAFVFFHSPYGGCTCAVVTVDSTGI